MLIWLVTVVTIFVQPFALFSFHFKGELYTWGRDEGDGRLGLGPGRGPSEASGLSIPSKVKALPVPVAAVSCGGFFTMALTKEGQLWNWGGENSTFFIGDLLILFFYFPVYGLHVVFHFKNALNFVNLILCIEH